MLTKVRIFKSFFSGFSKTEVSVHCTVLLLKVILDTSFIQYCVLKCVPYCQLMREEDRDQRLILKGYGIAQKSRKRDTKF